ncbi:MAG: transcriptional repressor [Chloroflexi bacterium]|nr:transcriptional repressor [Chloroflexota bacterium]
MASEGGDRMRLPGVPERPGTGSASADWSGVRARLHDGGLRWTPQRRTLIDVLAATDGHVTGAELVERCRAIDPTTTPSTVYRTLDVLEDLGVVRHHHGPDGREEFHVLPEREHGHLHCRACGRSWEVGAAEVAPMLEALRRHRGFEADISHMALVGRCGDCVAADDRAAGGD